MASEDGWALPERARYSRSRSWVRCMCRILHQSGAAPRLVDDPVIDHVRRLDETCLGARRHRERRLDPGLGHERGHLPARREGGVRFRGDVRLAHARISRDDLPGSCGVVSRQLHAVAVAAKESEQSISSRVDVVPPGDECRLGKPLRPLRQIDQLSKPGLSGEGGDRWAQDAALDFPALERRQDVRPGLELGQPHVLIGSEPGAAEHEPGAGIRRRPRLSDPDDLARKLDHVRDPGRDEQG